MNQTFQLHQETFEASHPSLWPDDSRPPRVAVVAAGWHSEIVGSAVDAIRAEFKKRQLPSDRLQVFHVPGSFEIPLPARRLAQTGRSQAMIAPGVVVNRGIYRQ